MWQWVGDHWEFVVGTAIGLIGIAIAIATVIHQRQPKQLDWELRNDVQLVSPHAQRLREKLALDYDGVPMQDPRVVIVRVANTGKKAVSKDDFVGGEPIKIAYAQNWPLDVQLVQASKGLSVDGAAEIELLYGKGFGEADVGDDFGKCQVIPSLLNPGEWLDIQLLSDHDHGEIVITARFADQRHPMRRVDLSSWFGTRRFIIAGVAAVIFGIVAGFILPQLLPPPAQNTFDSVMDMVFQVFGFAFLITMLILVIRAARRRFPKR
jgi:hypothetical protein